MEPFVESIYLREVLSQANWAITTVERMNALLESGDNPQEFFREAAGFVSHAAAVSRFLWPPRPLDKSRREEVKERGRYLREALRIEDSHALHKRTLRDHLEHFDERIDQWAAESPNRIMIDNAITSRDSIGGNMIQDTDIMRLYDPGARTFYFRGEEYDVQSLTDGLVDVRDRLKQRLDTIDSSGNCEKTKS